MRMRVASLMGMGIMSCVVVAAPARARLYDRPAGRFELGAEVAFWAFGTPNALSALEPDMLFGLAGGVYFARDWRAGVAARAAISDPHAEHYEVLADLTWSYVVEPRIPDPPAVRVGASLELGWRMTELTGSDFVLLEQGFAASLGGELGIVAFEDVALSLQLATFLTSSDNSARDAWAAHLRVGITLSTLL